MQNRRHFITDCVPVAYGPKEQKYFVSFFFNEAWEFWAIFFVRLSNDFIPIGCATFYSLGCSTNFYP